MPWLSKGTLQYESIQQHYVAMADFSRKVGQGGHMMRSFAHFKNIHMLPGSYDCLASISGMHPCEYTFVCVSVLVLALVKILLVSVCIAST